MALIDELRERLAGWDEEAQTLREKLKRLDDLMAHARALIEDERAKLPTPPPAVVKPVEPKQTVASVLDELLVPGQPQRFTDLRDLVRQRLFPHKEPVTVGKSVSAALNRAVAKGTVQQVSRGVYTALRRHAVDSSPSPEAPPEPTPP